MSGEHLQQAEKKSGIPRLRVYLLQGCRLEWTGMPAGQDIAWYHRSSARALFILLLCAPKRQASRSQLAGLLWPETDEEKANDSLRSALKYLRDVLRSGQGEDLLEAQGGTLTFKGQEHLWLDLDAIADLARQARNAATPHEALPFWEQDRVLLCEDLLVEERTSEWSQCPWIKVRRKELRAARRAMIRALSDFYLQSGQVAQAEELLHAHVIRFPTDQDALYRLMKLLIQAESFEEARTYYEQCRVALADLGKQPAEHIKALAQECRSRPQKMLAEWKSEQRLPQADRREETALSFSSSMTEGILKTTSIAEGNVMDQLRRQILIQTLQGAGGAIFASQGIGLSGAGLPTTSRLFGFMEAGISLHDEEILSVCATSLPISWRLYFDGQLPEVRSLLPGYISQLALLVRQPSQYQRRAAYYASQAHQLACMLALQEQDYGMAFTHVDQALQCAQIADDIQVRVASLIRKALVYRYVDRHLKKIPYQILEAYQEAEHYSSSVSPLLRGRLYTGLCEAHSKLGQEYEAKSALEQAYSIFPEQPQDDPNFSYTHFKLPQKFEAIMYLNLKQAGEAWELLAKVEASIPVAVIPDRVELLMDQTRASLLLGNLPQSCKYLELAVTSASALGSDLRYREASSLYREMRAKWPHEQQVKTLAAYFQY